MELNRHSMGAELQWNSVDSYSGTQWTVAVKLSRQLQWNLVDSYSGTQWTVTVELSGQLQ